MASTWSELGIRLMATGENSNAWGGQTNDNWNRLEDAADGFATVAVSGATTLTFTAQPTSYADENGRNKVLQFTGTAGGTQAITFPNIEKTYHVLNDSNSILTLTTGTGAATVTLAAGKDKMIYNDGSDEIHDALANLAITTIATSGAATITGALTSGAGGTIGAAGTATSVAGIPFYSADDSIYTHDVSGTDSTAEANAAYGIGALDAITTGDSNTSIGNGTLSGNTTGSSNIAIGKAAINVADTESNNLAIGLNALSGSVAGGEFNVAVGNLSLDALTSGDLNTAVGYAAGGALTTGAAQIFIGANAGAAVTTGGGNIAIGYNALDNADTESNNLAIGEDALGGAVNGGEFNVAIGKATLDALTSGDGNVAIGYNAGSSLTIGTKHVFIGYEAGASSVTNTDGSVCIGYQSGNALLNGGSVFIGPETGKLVTTGSSNVMVGFAAGRNFDTENHNIGMGTFALGGAIAGGENNIAIGGLALDAVTSGDDNVAIGYDAGTSITTGSYSTMVGRNAGASMVDQRITAVGYYAGANSTANQNNFFGFNCGSGNTSGQDNIAMGYNALYQPDTEDHNLAIGNAAMGGAIAGGEFNVAIGNNALDALTSGDNHTAIGYQAGSGLTTTSNNVFVGYKAGVLATTCEDNVCIGMEAAADGVWTGDDNVVIGKRAGAAFTSAYNNVLVGKDAGHSISTGGGNVCIGKASGQDPGATPITTGTDNIFIGNGTNTQASDGVNAIGIGTNFTVAANNFSFGKQSNVVSNVFTSDANWARASDERLKTNITSVSWDSLDFINAIRPVTFTWRNSNAVPTDMDEYDADKNHMDTTTVIDGLIAQEVKTAMDAHNMTNFSGWKTSSLGTQTLSKEAFVIPLIKAVQELSAQVTTLQQEINILKGE